ncbi:MAG: alpha/beta hydrolase [Ktedonobacteraceae bacterium]|nr:alpha/beta hydrolase [Ktedonobacteraceae bacterium]MBO0789426.1 alpha/beta hydrolase [Ktedonobacteraceae bacterium]
MEQHEVSIDGRRIPYKVAGQGQPVILIHGLSASMLWWTRNVAVLARHYRVYLVDLPGFGSLHRVRERFLIKNAATGVLRWIETLGLERVHLIGHSMGGYICMWIAAQRPTLVERLVLVAPAVMPRPESVPGYFIPLFNSLLHTTPSFLPILSYDILRAGPVTLWQAASDLLLLRDVHAEMSAVRAPTLLVWGESDYLVPVDLAPIVRDGIAGARLLLVRRAGHVPMFEQHAYFNQAVLAFLGGEVVGD